MAFNVIDEVDSYTKSIAGVEIEAFRTGRCEGPNTVLTVRDPRFTVTSSDVRMPLMSRTTLGDEKVVVAYMRTAPPGSRWCGIELQPGTLIVYGPSAEHTAITRPGLGWTFAITDADQIAALAEQLETPIELPRRGSVREIPHSDRSRTVGGTLSSAAEAARYSRCVEEKSSDDVMQAMVLALIETDRVQGIDGGRSISSRQITARCFDHANTIERVPSLSELCIAAHVSERRLRKAFIDEYEVPPARFFRTWALAEARRRLLDDDPTHHSVADVASGLGFFHLGRFAGYYRRLYDEHPSTTLRMRVAERGCPTLNTTVDRPVIHIAGIRGHG